MLISRHNSVRRYARENQNPIQSTQKEKWEQAQQTVMNDSCTFGVALIRTAKRLKVERALNQLNQTVKHSRACSSETTAKTACKQHSTGWPLGHIETHTPNTRSPFYGGLDRFRHSIHYAARDVDPERAQELLNAGLNANWRADLHKKIVVVLKWETKNILPSKLKPRTMYLGLKYSRSCYIPRSALSLDFKRHGSYGHWFLYNYSTAAQD